MTGAEDTKISIIAEMNNHLNTLDREGGTYARVTRERVDNVMVCHNTLQTQFSALMENMGKMQISLLTLTILTIILAIMAGGTMVWNIVKVFLHVL